MPGHRTLKWSPWVLAGKCEAKSEDDRGGRRTLGRPKRLHRNSHGVSKHHMKEREEPGTSDFPGGWV